jgi:hypothetical protein
MWIGLFQFLIKETSSDLNNLEKLPATHDTTRPAVFTTGNCGFANSPSLSQPPRPELLAKKLFPNRKTLLSGKKSSPTAQNPRTVGKVRECCWERKVVGEAPA